MLGVPSGTQHLVKHAQEFQQTHRGEREAFCSVIGSTNHLHQVWGDQKMVVLFDEADVDISGTLFDAEANSHTAPRDTAILAIYPENLDPATVSAQSFVVHAMQTGQLVEPTSRVNVQGSTVSLTLGQSLHAGELVQVTATGSIKDLEGRAPIPSFGWQVRAGTSGGSAVFDDSGQSLGDAASYDVALGDLDDDGDLDAFVANREANKVWLNDGAATFRDSGQPLGNEDSRAVVLGDVDGDGDLDAFVANGGGHYQRIKVWLNDGKGNFRDSGQSISGGDVALGDLDGDGDLDAFVANYGPNNVLLNDGAGAFRQSGQSIGDALSFNGRAVSLGDLDGDGDLDAFVVQTGGGGFTPGGKIEVWLNDGDGSFSESGQRSDSPGGPAVLGDLDQDGDLDALIVEAAFLSPDKVKVWLNNGQGSLLDTGRDIDLADDVYDLQLGDIDGDGDLDVFVGHGGYFTGPDRVLLNDGEAIFSDSGQSLGSNGDRDEMNTRAMAMSDLDGDGDLDVFVATARGNKVWLNFNLAAGDANRDREFNSADISQVLVTGKYETGRADCKRFPGTVGLDTENRFRILIILDQLAVHIESHVRHGTVDRFIHGGHVGPRIGRRFRNAGRDRGSAVDARDQATVHSI